MKKILPCILLAAVAVAITGCGKKDNPAPEAPKAPETAPAAPAAK